MPAWWRLAEGSVKATALAAEYAKEQLRQSAAAELGASGLRWKGENMK